MAGAWSDRDNRPVRPGIQTATQEPSAPQVLTVVVAGTAGQSGPAPLPSPTTKGCAWQPNPGQGRTRLSELPADRRGGRPLVRVAQDRVPLGQGGKLPFLKTLGGDRRYPEAEIRELAEELREDAMT
jgi:hypothetical protein